MNLTGVQACTVQALKATWPSIEVHPGFLLVYTMSKRYLGLHQSVPDSKRGQLHHASDQSRKRVGAFLTSLLAQSPVGRQSEAVGKGSEEVGTSRKRSFPRVVGKDRGPPRSETRSRVHANHTLSTLMQQGDRRG
jgi:hypothetical protein